MKPIYSEEELAEIEEPKMKKRMPGMMMSTMKNMMSTTTRGKYEKNTNEKMCCYTGAFS